MTDRERRNHDEAIEKIVHNFLEKYLWSTFPGYKSNDDAATQKLGCDCWFIGDNNEEYACDEKATSEAYIDLPYEKRLKTFCLETSSRSLTRDNTWVRHEGWFLKEDSITDIYCLVWIDTTYKEEGKILNVDSIKEAEIILVKKEDILTFLESKGWPYEKICEQVQIILDNPEKYYGTKIINSLKFNTPKWLAEKEAPVNILLTREDYRSIAYKAYNFNNGKLTQTLFNDYVLF